MQLPLPPPEPFDPYDDSAGLHYVPVVQNRFGELWALETLPLAVRPAVTPMIQMVGPRRVDQAPSTTALRDWVKRVAHAVGDRPVFLDVLRFADGLVATDKKRPRHALLHLHDE